MQNDKRLIDANADVTIQVFDEMTGEYSMETITVAKAIDRWSDEGCPPTIDAVEVVRCRECFYKDIPKCCPYQINGFEVVSNWYCPMGVRKMDAKEADHG